MTGHPAVHGDPGLQPERTSLAWSRTILALLTTSAVTLRWIDLYGPAVLTLLGLLVVLALMILAQQRRRYRVQTRGLARGGLRANAAAVVALTAALVVLGASGIALVVATQLR